MPDDHSEEISHELPSAEPTIASSRELMAGAAAPALAIWFDDALFNRAKLIASYLAKAEGFTPRHLINKPAACFAVVERALTWRLSPYAVAQSTFQIPGSDRVGYEGKLCQAILENSGKLEGPVRYEHYGSVTVRFANGRTKTFRTNDPKLDAAMADKEAKVVAQYDWENIYGKFEIKRNDKGREYAVPTWANEDTKGLGVTVTAKVSGETEPRRLDFDLIQAYPRNSTLWATDPKTQICYAAVRRFASVAASGLFMGIPFDQDDVDPAIAARDVTPPRPLRPVADTGFPTVDDAPAPPKEAEPNYDMIGHDGVIHAVAGVDLGLKAFRELMEAAAKEGGKSLEGFWESNGLFLTQLRERGYTEQADHLGEEYGKLLDAAAKPKDQKPPEQKPADPTQQEAPQQAQNAAPAAKPKEVEDLPPFLDRRKNKKPADAPVAQVPTKTPTSPLIKNGGGSWTAFLPWFADQLREIAEADIPSFLGQYKAEYDYLGAHREGDREAIDAIIDGRRK